MQLAKITAIAILPALLAPNIANAATLGELGEKIAKTTGIMLQNHGHVTAAKNWPSSDAYLLTEDASYLKAAVAKADAQCDRYAAKKLWWSPAAYNKLTNQIISDVMSTTKTRTFAPTAEQQENAHYVALAAATAYEAEKAVCPEIVWRR